MRLVVSNWHGSVREDAGQDVGKVGVEVLQAADEIVRDHCRDQVGALRPPVRVHLVVGGLGDDPQKVAERQFLLAEAVPRREPAPDFLIAAAMNFVQIGREHTDIGIARDGEDEVIVRRAPSGADR